jgi:hypothetical protein
VPGFVKTHLNKNCRYLPETFILRVNYWRRRRAVGDDSKSKSKEVVVRACQDKKDKDKEKDKDKDKTRKEEKKGGGGSGTNGSVMSTPRADSVMTSSRSSRPPTVIIST